MFVETTDDGKAMHEAFFMYTMCTIYSKYYTLFERNIIIVKGTTLQMDLDKEGLGRAALNLGRSRGQENVIIVDTDKDSSSSTFFYRRLPLWNITRRSRFSHKRCIYFTGYFQKLFFVG